MQRAILAAFVRLAVSVKSLAIGGSTAWAQTESHKPAQQTHSGTPAAAPRTPVQQAAPRHHTPVVTPHGAAHAQKPTSMPAAAKPVAAAPDKPAVKPAEQPAAPPAAKPVPAIDPTKGATTSLPLPRFASLRSDDVNLRSGPGTRYPIEWEYKRRDLPVEIEREFEVWRLIKDPDGIRGWVHQATLTGRRSFLVTGPEATLRAAPHDTAPAVAVLKPGVIGRIRSCEARSDWCQMQVGAYRGFLRRSQIWGTLPDEIIKP